MKVDVLRCWKSEHGVSGEYYVYDDYSDNKYFIIQNCNDIKAVAHYADRKVEECIARPTQAVKDAIIMASVEYLKQI